MREEYEDVFVKAMSEYYLELLSNVVFREIGLGNNFGLNCVGL